MVNRWRPQDSDDDAQAPPGDRTMHRFASRGTARESRSRHSPTNKLYSLVKRAQQSMAQAGQHAAGPDPSGSGLLSPLSPRARGKEAVSVSPAPLPADLRSPRPLDMPPSRAITPPTGTPRPVSRPMAPTPGAVPRLQLEELQPPAGGSAAPGMTTARDVALDVQATARSGARGGEGGDGGAAVAPTSRTAAWVLSDGKTFGELPGGDTGGRAGSREGEGRRGSSGSRAGDDDEDRALGADEGNSEEEEEDRESEAPGGDAEGGAVGGFDGARSRAGASRVGGAQGAGGADDQSDVGEEAGAVYTDFKRGKRYRKLCKLLGNVQVRCIRALGA